MNRNDWDTKSPQQCIELITQWSKALPKDIVENILTGTILPRLKKEVDNWDPKREPIPIHAWIHPWLPVLSTETTVNFWMHLF